MNDFVLLLSKGAERKLAAWTTGEAHAAAIGGLNFKSASSIFGDGKATEFIVFRATWPRVVRV